jgi:Predicted AAA-ATPase/PD-(D/E)XK nuclease superfamily
LVWKLEEVAKLYSISIDNAPSLQTKFGSLVEQLASADKVVILIDEYDYPILNNIDNPELAIACRNILNDFFGVIKDLDSYLQFVFLTGVSKFSKTSIFSGLNNLEDLTLSAQGATLLGYTQQEVAMYFEPYIKRIALAKKTVPKKVIEAMRTWYNGYQFSEDDHSKVYNPYSILLFLSSGKFLNYWFETGTPSFLMNLIMNLIKTKNFTISAIDNLEATSEELGTIEVDDIPIVTLLFQTGYITIGSYDAETENYHLAFPNLEVRSSFLRYLLRKFTKINLSTINEFALRFTKALKENNVDLFCRLLQTFFADIPCGIQIPELEKYYQTIIFILAKILGLTVNVEVMTNIGRIDMTIEMATHIYIFEFKTRESAGEALKQIEERKYYEKYTVRDKEIVLVGIMFDVKKRNLESWVVKTIR